MFFAQYLMNLSLFPIWENKMKQKHIDTNRIDIVFIKCDECLGITPHKVSKNGTATCNFCKKLTSYHNLLSHSPNLELTT